MDTNPKQRVRERDPQSFSPASPARPNPVYEGPPSSNRPRGSGLTPLPRRREGIIPYGQNQRDGHRSHGERQFFQYRRDSYRRLEPHQPNYPRNFANEGSRSYLARYGEVPDDERYGHRSSFHDGHRFNPGDSRLHRHESFGDHSSYPHMRRDQYDDYRHHDEWNRGGYVHRHGTPPHLHGSGYGRDYSDRHGNETSSGPLNVTESFPRDTMQELVWMDETRPAISLKPVPLGTSSEDLLLAFRRFRPRRAIYNGHKTWMMWFDEANDRNNAASKGYLMFQNCRLEVKVRTHVIGRKSTYVEIPYGSWISKERSRDVGIHNLVGGQNSVVGSGTTKNQRSANQYSRHHGRSEELFNSSLRETGGHPPTYREADDRFISGIDTHHRVPDSERTSALETGESYNRREWRDKGGKRRTDRDGDPEPGGRDEQRARREGSLDECERSRNVSSDVAIPDVASITIKNGSRTTISDASDNVRKADVERTLSPNRGNTPNESRADPTENGAWDAKEFQT